MTRRWRFNGRFLSQGMTGVQRYAFEILRELDALIVEGHALTESLALELLTPRGVAPPPLSAIVTRSVGVRRGHSWEQFDLPDALDGAGLLSLGNLGPLRARRQILCVHDANVWLAPDSYARAFRAAYKLMLPLLARRVAAVTTVSEFSRAELARLGVTARRAVAVIPDAADHVARWAPQEAEALPDLSNCVLAIGAAAPHKNLGVLAAAAPGLARAGVRIAMTGGGARRVFAGERKPREGVIALGRLSDGGLAAAMGACLCLAFPSLTEGFGLPPLEAMALGCPVISSNRASLPEICGDAALYADPDDPAQWRAQILRLRDDPDLRLRLVAAGRERAARYRWRASALAYLDLMARLDALGPQARL